MTSPTLNANILVDLYKGSDSLFDLSNLTEEELLEKLLLIQGVNRNGLIELIRSTRHYEFGLELAELFETLRERNRESLTIHDISAIDLLIIQLKLTCLDGLDRWNAFVHYYDFLITQNYDSFGIEALLSIQKYRYDVIKRKIDRSSKGKKLGNSFHKPQSELTDEDIELRTNKIIDWIKHI